MNNLYMPAYPDMQKMFILRQTVSVPLQGSWASLAGTVAMVWVVLDDPRLIPGSS
jgi:hypothetical protein